MEPQLILNRVVCNTLAFDEAAGWPAVISERDARLTATYYERFCDKKPTLMGGYILKQLDYDPSSGQFKVIRVFRPDIRLAFHLHIQWVIFKHRAKKISRAFTGR